MSDLIVGRTRDLRQQALIIAWYAIVTSINTESREKGREKERQKKKKRCC